jgi:hypothetical protein
MRTYSVFLALFLMLFALRSLAGNVEVAQWIPWSFVTTQAKKIPLAFQSTQSNFQMNFQEWTPKATNVNFQVQGGLSTLQFDQNGVQAAANTLSAHLTVGQILIDQVIVRDIGGSQIQVRVQATCQPFEIQVSNFSLAAQAPFVRLADHWTPQLSTVSLQLPQGAWTVSPIVCQGPEGIDQKIASLIQTTLSQPASMQEYLKSWLAPQLDQYWGQIWKSLTGEAWQNLKINSMSDPAAQGFFLYGNIETKSSGSVPLPSNLTAALSATVPQLFFSTEAFAALVQENASSVKIENYDLQQIESFSSFMHNRFLQFFMWPDLLNFSRSTPVLFSTLPDQTKVTLQAQKSGVWNLQMQSMGVLRITRKGQLRNYINVGIGMTSTLTTEVKDSHLSLKTQNSKSNISWKFDSEYIRLFDPSTSISSTLLKKASTALFENRTIDQALPVLNWNGQTFKLNGWKQQGSMVSLDWK